jgi:hypothetical protein
MSRLSLAETVFQRSSGFSANGASNEIRLRSYAVLSLGGVRVVVLNCPVLSIRDGASMLRADEHESSIRCDAPEILENMNGPVLPQERAIWAGSF